MWLLSLAHADDLTVERARVQLEAERPAQAIARLAPELSPHMTGRLMWTYLDACDELGWSTLCTVQLDAAGGMNAGRVLTWRMRPETVLRSGEARRTPPWHLPMWRERSFAMAHFGWRAAEPWLDKAPDHPDVLIPLLAQPGGKKVARLLRKRLPKTVEDAAVLYRWHRAMRAVGSKAKTTRTARMLSKAGEEVPHQTHVGHQPTTHTDTYPPPTREDYEALQQSFPELTADQTREADELTARAQRDGLPPLETDLGLQAYQAYLAHDLERALTLHHLSLLAAPSDSAEWTNMGLPLKRMEQYAAERGLHEVAEALAPDDPFPKLNLALCQAHLGDHAAAAATMTAIHDPPPAWAELTWAALHGLAGDDEASVAGFRAAAEVACQLPLLSRIEFLQDLHIEPGLAHVRSTEDIDGWAEACPVGDVLLTPP